MMICDSDDESDSGLIGDADSSDLESDSDSDKTDNGAMFVSIAETWNHIGNVHMQRGDTEELMHAYTMSLRFFHRAGKADNSLSISGCNFYGMSKLHPECAAQA